MTQITGIPGAQIACQRCGAAFACNPGAECWCIELPPLPMPSDEGERCLCPACLKAEIQSRSNAALSD